MTELNENKLIQDYSKGDPQSFELLIKHYLKPVYGFVYRFVGTVDDAEDVTQDVFIRVWKNIKKFDQQKSFKTWIFSIAKNAALDFLKKKKAIPFSAFENEVGDNVLFETLADPAPLPDELWERQDIAAVVKDAVKKLPVPYRLVLFLHYNDHFTFQEIAETLEESINTVKSRHRRALIMLRKILDAPKVGSDS